MGCFGSSEKRIEPLLSVLRCLENIPIIGHIIALFYACCGSKSQAERAGLKATVGIVMAVINLPAEIIDESARTRSRKIYTSRMNPRSDWMKKFQRRTLRHLCLPGSHQSGSYTIERKLRSIPMVQGWSQCQTLDIWAQLNGGIRFLDIHIMSDVTTEDIWLYNNDVICVRLRHVLRTVRRFVNHHPTEIVCLNLTSDGLPVDWQTTASLLHEHLGTRIIPEQMFDMCIGDIVAYRRNFILFGDEKVPFRWRCLDIRLPNVAWPTDLSEDFHKTAVSLRNSNPYFLFWYKAECTPDRATVIRGSGGLPGLLAYRRAPEKLDSLQDLAASANFEIDNALTFIQFLPFSVLSTDHVVDSIIQKIIDSNIAGMAGMEQSASLKSMQALSGSMSLPRSSMSSSRFSDASFMSTNTDRYMSHGNVLMTHNLRSSRSMPMLKPQYSYMDSLSEEPDSVFLEDTVDFERVNLMEVRESQL